MTLPAFVGVGASKSGTTSLARWLEAHPELYVVPQKELRFFTQSWDNGVEWYADRFRDAAGRPAGEFTPDYMNDPEAIARLAATVPDAKLVVCLREPVSRLLSHYWHQRRRGSERRPLRRAVEEHGDYVARGDYLPQLERLAAAYPRERIHVALFDDLRDRPADAFAAACRFLDVDDSVRPEVLGIAFNTASSFRSKALRVQMLRVGAFDRAPGLARRIDTLNRKAVRNPEPSASDLAWLAERCAYDRSALEAWLGLSLPSDWTTSA